MSRYSILDERGRPVYKDPDYVPPYMIWQSATKELARAIDNSFENSGTTLGIGVAIVLTILLCGVIASGPIFFRIIDDIITSVFSLGRISFSWTFWPGIILDIIMIKLVLLGIWADAKMR